MRVVLWSVAAFCVVLCACTGGGKNPFFTEFSTPHGVPPFEDVKIEHFRPAYQEAFKRHLAEIDAITANKEAPTFENTIDALELSGDMLSRVSGTFGVLNGTMTNDELQAIDEEIAPQRAAHADRIRLNADLFSRIKSIYDERDRLTLTSEQRTVLDKYYRDFVRSGALLDEDQKAELMEINKELSLLSVQFGQNVLKEVNKFELIIEDRTDLAGLPESVIQAAAETAAERGHEGKWVFTISKPSMIPFLQYSGKRDLREKIYKAYINQGNNDDELDNKKGLAKIASLRVRKANLLGYKSWADFILEERMAKKPSNVYDLLNRIWRPAVKVAQKEADDMQKMIDEEGGNFKLAAWDWWYYSGKIKKARFDLDESMLRPYFKLENVIEKGAFYVANKLWGLHFIQRDDLPKYHEDVTVYEVEDADGSHLAILYTDYFPRASKRGGAWCSDLQAQQRVGGVEKYPILTNNGNFTKPTADSPSLLSLEEVLTLFHEFGHALHGLLSDCTYPRVSGSNVAWDFVEMHSQMQEHWATEPEVMKNYALHYETGEIIPDDLIKKIKKAGHFNQGFATVEYVAASLLDMDWHTIADTEIRDATAFEQASAEKMGLMDEIAFRYRSPYFSHIFNGGYSAGYYSYIWAEVLDTDAFGAFKEKGIFNPKTAKALRDHIYSRGGTEDPMVLYKRFRGREPKVDALLEKRGLK